MGCKQCEILRAKLSPLVDHAFMAKFEKVEPVEFYTKVTCLRDGVPAYRVSAAQVWAATPGFLKPNVANLAALGRVLAYKGWERTRVHGQTYFVMTVQEFEHVYGDA